MYNPPWPPCRAALQIFSVLNQNSNKNDFYICNNPYCPPYKCTDPATNIQYLMTNKYLTWPDNHNESVTSLYMVHPTGSSQSSMLMLAIHPLKTLLWTSPVVHIHKSLLNFWPNTQAPTQNHAPLLILTKQLPWHPTPYYPQSNHMPHLQYPQPDTSQSQLFTQLLTPDPNPPCSFYNHHG